MKKEVLIQQFLEFTDNLEECNDFIQSCNQNILTKIDQIGLVLIAPESFALGITNRVIKFLEFNDLVVLDINIINKLSDEDLSRLYLPPIKPYTPKYISSDFRWWLIEKRFRFGPVCALLVGSKYNIKSTIPEKLAKVKGYRIPYFAESNSLRATLPSINGILNLVHTSHNSAFVLREGKIFFDHINIIKAIEKSEEIKLGKRCYITSEEIETNYLRGYQSAIQDSGSFFQIYFNIQQRILRILSSSTDNEIIKTLLRLANKGYDQSVIKLKRNQLLETFLDIIEDQKQLIKCKNNNELQINSELESLYTAFLFFLNYQTASYYNWIDFIKILELSGLKISEWERLVILTTLFKADTDLPSKNKD
ncbi:nucleoside-diphosphate kinase [Evansella sp. AB-P1]|uniref:nucleoside-diphosphate kinase n=1 Tax=Evansella sp. AB-P1 TaxID=3037653 RepID=UPI00241D9370|nr:nucleoside-diphosphate kinase [Evansella sp. AB-P1]MDG5788614.1 nucleoside-diphosphate kinase [Evansella sp. AB-P1]